MGCSGSKLVKLPALKKWDDNQALREAGLEELNKEQLKAFGFFWEQYVRDVFEMTPED